jgi:hypothetical protein
MRALRLFVFFAFALGCNHAAEEPSAPVIKDAAAPARTDAGPALATDAGTDAGEIFDDAGGPGCFTNPTTYLEIINACTDAQAVDKVDDLSPMNLPDGGLQPLP